MLRTIALTTCALVLAVAQTASASEICGNGLDDNANGLTDEGCYNLASGVCESPLSCDETGSVSPKMGSLRYQLPPDVAPRVPYGPGIGLRRFYTSMYAPAGGAPAWHKPMGERWQHTYSTWITKTGTPPTGHLVLHTNRGQDVRATFYKSAGGWDIYKPQAGYHVDDLRQRQASPNEFQLRTLTGETFVYNSAGRLIEIWDTLSTPNKVLLTYDGVGQVSTVTDASGKRRLLFGYTSGVLGSVQFQLYIAGAWTTQHTTSYSYTSGNLTSVTIGGVLAQTNVYTSNYLTQIQDGGGKTLVAFAYNATPGKAARIDTTHGLIGFDYSSSRASCSGKTVLYFNVGNTSTCDTDANCGAGFLCGGKTGAGSTGRCFRGARCLTTSSPNEDVITTVDPIGPPSESCTGSCTDVAEYVWDTVGGKLDLKAVKDPSTTANYTSRTFNSNGLPTTITYGDPDTDATNTNQARTEWLYYGNASFPGRVTEIRRKSDFSDSAASCSSTNTVGCARTLFSYNSNGKLATLTQSGSTVNVDNAPTTFSYVTTFSYDTKGRLTQIDGPLSGSHDVTVFEYYAATGTLNDDFLRYFRRKKDSSNFLVHEAFGYDFWGNPAGLIDADGTYTCLKFTASRGVLEERREAMAGQANCTTADSTDLVTKWGRDHALRLVQLTRPDDSCLFFEYDTKGRLQRTKRRDDCNAGSSGDRQEFVYDTEGLLTEIQTYDASNTLTARQPFTYFDSRRLEKIVNPVDVSKWTGISYDPRGLVSQIDGAGNIGKTVFKREGVPGADGRVTSVEKYKTSTAADVWNLLYAWLGEQTSVKDGDNKETLTTRDDLGRVIRESNPDTNLAAYPTVHLYDAASRRTSTNEQYGAYAQRRHTMTYDNLGRPLLTDYGVIGNGTCFGSTNPPEIERVYDAPPVTCPIPGGCNHTQGRLAYVRKRLLCNYTPPDNSLDQETFYSYDAAGRVVREYIRDDASRVANHQYVWTKNGELAQFTTPNNAVLGWTFDNGSSNSDRDRVTAVWRTNTSSPIIDNITWNPYGPLKQYNQQNALSSNAIRTRITRNLAYRPTGLYVETQTGGTTLHSVVLTEDAKGRITSRDYTPNTGGVQDSYFRYDDMDRLLCETTTSVGSCPTSGSNIKNSHTLSPPFTNAGDWKRLLRPIPGSTGLTHNFTLNSSNHQVTQIVQADGTPTLGTTDYAYGFYGNRFEDYNWPLTGINGYRSYDYDFEHNVSGQYGYYRIGATWYQYYETHAFDSQRRRVFKSFRTVASGATSTWFYYYDPFDRLTEVRYTPITSAESVYQVFQLIWLGDRLIGYWQTDYPSGTTTKRYVGTDESSRPIDMWSWPASGDTTRVWAVNPSAWGMDTITTGASVYQPILFAGQQQDRETAAYLADGTTIHRPGLVWNRLRSYDAFTGAYLQVDPRRSGTWSSYVYADSSPVGKQDPSGASWCLPESGCVEDSEFGGTSGGVHGYCSWSCASVCNLSETAAFWCDCSACGGSGVGGGGQTPPICSPQQVAAGCIPQSVDGTNNCLCPSQTSPIDGTRPPKSVTQTHPLCKYLGSLVGVAVIGGVLYKCRPTEKKLGVSKAEQERNAWGCTALFGPLASILAGLLAADYCGDVVNDISSFYCTEARDELIDLQWQERYEGGEKVTRTALVCRQRKL